MLSKSNSSNSLNNSIGSPIIFSSSPLSVGGFSDVRNDGMSSPRPKARKSLFQSNSSIDDDKENGLENQNPGNHFSVTIILTNLQFHKYKTCYYILSLLI